MHDLDTYIHIHIPRVPYHTKSPYNFILVKDALLLSVLVFSLSLLPASPHSLFSGTSFFDYCLSRICFGLDECCISSQSVFESSIHPLELSLRCVSFSQLAA